MMKNRIAVLLAVLASAVAGVAGAEDASKGVAPKTLKLDHESDFPMTTGCTFYSSVKGTVQSRGSAALFDPNIAVVSEVRCPKSATLKTTENVMSIGPLSYVELEERLERRATVTSPTGGCLYVPDFKLAGTKLDTVSVRFLCERPAK